ncbi:DUF3397 domain-containing protein [Streptococcus loxodontisalivarius]|uniref:Magnesium-transporting ATPase (P-type) n=1 Tax=Streptococcus loxodontisalivarius TaxID=1349415 RepID=A0ABS2PVP2_9STRE|nr:DUF3397 domain-containing protein [Streptococcus loxodontisalivarius]MBM7643780.1 magnesium-transporting ATPase (P-type) [Streptococcus loxodontisalivarius]
MTIYTIIAILFLLLTPLFATAIVRLFNLTQYGIKFPDLTLPLYAFEINFISAYLFENSVLFYYLMLMAVLAVCIVLGLSRKKRILSYRRWFKIFWRAAFLVTIVFYITTLVASLIL